MAMQRTSLARAPSTGELATEGEAPLPAPVERSPELMPAIEPERRIDDWGRSERVEGLFDRTVVEFFYRYWFRTEVEGVENVPSTGGSLLVSNHSGALPPDAATIGKAIKEEHSHPRPLYITVEHFFKGYPGFSMLIPPTSTASSTTRDGSSSSFPRVGRGPRSCSRIATGSSASAAADSSRRRFGPRRRWCRCAWWEPRRRRRSSPTSTS
jgi:hypothetical protein